MKGRQVSAACSLSAQMVLSWKPLPGKKVKNEGTLLISLRIELSSIRQALFAITSPRIYNQEHHPTVDNAMKARCPNCGHIPIRLPPTHKCPECGVFSHEWLIYDWESFASSRREHLNCNILIISLVAINIVALVTFESSNLFFWMLNTLSIPAIISLFLCLNDLRGQGEYEGHDSRAVLPWFTVLTGLGGL